MKKEYLNDLIQLNNDVVILSTTLADILEINHDEFISKINSNLNLFSADCITNYENNLALNEKGIAYLAKVFDSDDHKVLCSNIINAMIEMAELIESNSLKEDFSKLSFENDFIPNIKQKLTEMVQKNLEATENRFFNQLSLEDKKKLGLTN